MKKEFQKPILNIYRIDVNNIISTSGNADGGDIQGGVHYDRRWGGWNTGRQTDADTSDED